MESRRRMPKSVLSRRASNVCERSVLRAKRKYMTFREKGYLFQPKQNCHRRTKQEDRTQQIWQRIGPMLQPPHPILPPKQTPLSKNPRITPHRIRKQPPQNWPNNNPDIEAHRHQQECPRLKLLLPYDLTNHRSHNPHIPIQCPSHRPEHRRLPETSREAEAHARDTGTHEPNQQHRFSAHFLIISHATPQHRRHKLRCRKGTLQHARLSRDSGGRKAGIEGFELVEHVCLERGLGQGFGETGHGEDGELALVG